MGKRHVAARLPVADGLRFAELAAEGGFRAHVQPESQMRAQRHGVEPAHVFAVDAAHHTAANQGEDITVREHDRAGAQRRQDAVLDLVKEICGVHQDEREAGHRVFGEEFINISPYEIRTPQAAGLYGEAFRLQPFLQKSDLRRASRAVHAFNHDQAAGNFAGIKANQGLAEKLLRAGIFGS